MLFYGQVGPQILADGTSASVRQDKTGALVVNQFGKYYEATYRGSKFSASVGGAGQVLVAANLFSTAIASFQPIFCLYNPQNNVVNFVIQHIYCGVTADPASAGVTGGFLLVANNNQNITNASSPTPVNTKTLKAIGSQAVVVLNATLTGAVGNPILLRPVQSTNALSAQGATVTPLTGTVFVEETSGSIIVPPGAYLAIANGISNTTATVIAGMDWDEVPV